MNEKLLHFIWKMKRYDAAGLSCTDGQPLQILHPGQANFDAGPDFLQARVMVGKVMLAGNIELHILSSDWDRHKHSADANYNNTILHVVWENDKPVSKELPTLELKGRISNLLLSKYRDMMENSSQYPCEGQIHTVPEIVVENWLQRIAIERLSEKSARMQAYNLENQNHWEESFWWMLARNFGGVVNGEAFEAMARTIPLNVLAKNKHQHIQLEAMLFGQANLLQPEASDPYAVMLSKEYKYLKKKYNLAPSFAIVKFLKMRPASFPTLRLSQLAQLIYKSNHLFSKCRESGNLHEVYDLFSLEANDYWSTHYRFDEPSDFKIKNLGRETIDNLILNTVIPAMFAFAQEMNDNRLKQKTLNWLEELPAENNKYTRLYTSKGCENKNALQSQAWLHLFKNYCSPKRCLECSIGGWLLKKG